MAIKRWEFLCVLVLAAVVLISAVMLLVTRSWTTVDGAEVWVGWMWLGIIVLIVVALTAEILCLPEVQRRLRRH
ncbi:MAG: hypothetical protein ACFFCO_03030 [Promethearchaeota archaeon]